MALTITESGENRSNLGFGQIIQEATFQPAAADYATGGYPMYTSSGSAPNNAGQPFGFGLLRGLFFIGFTGTALNYIWLYNRTTCKVQVFSAPGVEVAAGTDLSGGTATVVAFGM